MGKVRWTYRDSRDGEWCRHYRGKYVVECQDMDGDGTEWFVALRTEQDAMYKQLDDYRAGKELSAPWSEWRLARGFVGHGSDFEIAKVAAIATLEAIIRDAEEMEAERTSQTV